MSSTYVEIFHSKPSWSLAYIQRLLSPTPPSWASVSPSDALTDASHIREKFRVHRLDLRSLPGQTLRFTVTNGTLRDWDGPPDNPAGWFEISAGGRYVVEHGMRRVGDVGEECVRLLEHPLDTWVEVAFVAELWERCFFAFQRDGEDWVPKPGVEMTLVKGAGERRFEVAVRAKGCTFAFNNGKVGDEEVWDSNHGQNFRIGAPGRYTVVDGRVEFIGRAQNDVKSDAGTDAPAAKAPASAIITAPGAKTSKA